MPLGGKRIIIVLGALAIAGAERQALLLARRLKGEYGAVPEIWGVWDPSPSTLGYEDEVPQHIHHVRWQTSPLVRLANLVKLGLALRRARPDVLMPFTMPPNFFCGLIWKITGASTCIWNQRDEGFTRRPQLGERLAARLTPWFASNSARGRSFLVDTLNVPATRIRVIDNGVEAIRPDVPRAEWRRRLGLDESSVLACMVGNFQSWKDHETLIRAWRVVLDGLLLSGENATLLLAGGAGDVRLEDLQALVRGLALEPHVIFLGYVPDVPSLLGAVDIGVFSSKTEGAPNGVLEVMAAGLPVVGTNIPGVAHLVGGGDRAQLAEPGDEHGLAERILALVRDPALRRTLGTRNKTRVEQEFSPDRMCREYVGLIETALANPRAFS